MSNINIEIYLYDQVEVLDFADPFEVFSTASRICSSGHPFTVFTVGETEKTITARGGLSVNPTYGFDNHPQIDVLIVAGGVHTDEIQKANVLNWVFKVGEKTKRCGLFSDKPACLDGTTSHENQQVMVRNMPKFIFGQTHWEDISDLQKSYPGLLVQLGKRLNGKPTG